MEMMKVRFRMRGAGMEMWMTRMNACVGTLRLEFHLARDKVWILSRQGHDAAVFRKACTKDSLKGTVRERKWRV